MFTGDTQLKVQLLMPKHTRDAMNNKRMLLAALLACSSYASQAQAVFGLNNELRLSTGLQSIDYVEIDKYGATSDGVLDGEKGRQPLLGLTWSMQPQKGRLAGLFTQVDLRLADGKTDYTGYLQNFKTGELTPYKYKGVKAVTYDLGVKVGVPIVLDHGYAQIIPYGFVGHHHWIRDSSSSVYGYREDYFHNTFAVGAKLQTMLNRSLALEADVMLGRTQDAKMNLALTGKDYKLSSRDVTRIEVAAIQRLSPTLAMRYGFDTTKFKYGESPVVDGFFEPASKSTIQTFTVGLSILY